MLPGSEPIKVDDTSTKEEFLRLARDRAAIASTWWRKNFEDALSELEFLYGKQWDQKEAAERTKEGRPCLTLNKLPAFVDQVLGDQRQNRPSIHVHPVESDATTVQQKTGAQPAQPLQGRMKNTAGTKDYTNADVLSGLIRNIETTSDADSHYDRAFQHAVESGFGWLRVITAYSTDDAFDLDIQIKSIRNRFAVLMDPSGLSESDFSASNYCFVLELMRRKEFTKRYPDAGVTDLGTGNASGLSWWIDEDMVMVAEYFYREPVTRRLLQLSNGNTVWHDDIKDIEDEMAQQGITITRERKVKTYKVMWAKITGSDILEGPVDVPFRTIPIVPVFGKDVTIENETYYRGLTRYGQDSQRMHNYWFTAATERVALAPKAQWVIDAKSIEGLESIWSSANRKNWSYLPYRHRTDVPPPRREQPPQMPNSELQLVTYASDEIKATIGMFDASLGQQGNETSGKAILARQRQGDRGTFAFIDNLNRAVRRVGKLCVEAIPYTYDAERIIRIKFPDGGGDWIRVNQVIRDRQTGKDIVLHDLAEGKYDITVMAGPSYQTQRLEAADSLMQFVQAVPAAGGVVLDLIAKNMDWPGAEEISKRLKKILPPGTLTPEEMQDAGIQAPQPSPADQVAMAKVQADMETAKAKEATAQAQMAQSQVLLSQIAMQAQTAGQGTMQETIKNLVAEAMAEILHMSQQGAPQAGPPPQQPPQSLAA
jgi:hypothetical protein